MDTCRGIVIYFDWGVLSLVCLGSSFFNVRSFGRFVIEPMTPGLNVSFSIQESAVSHCLTSTVHQHIGPARVYLISISARFSRP